MSTGSTSQTYQSDTFKAQDLTKNTPRKFTLGYSSTLLLTSFLMMLSCNQTFFKKTIEIYPLADNIFFLLSLAVFLYCTILLITALFSLLIPLRFLAPLMLLIAALSAYFTDQYGTIFDDVMIRNMLETNTAEAQDLFSLSLLVQIVYWVVLPSILIAVLYQSKISRKNKIFQSLFLSFIALCVAVLLAVSFGSHYASFFRKHKQLRYLVNPVYPIYSVGNLLSAKIKSSNNKFVTLTGAASIVEPHDSHPELVILVVGETARYDRFSLNGYERETNPLLKKEERLISYNNMFSCGTSTAVSVPCMFSLFAKKDFDLDSARRTENVLDVLSKAGVSVLWRDNNSDSKGVATRVSYEDFRSAENNPNCDDECRDIGMLSGLQEYLDTQTHDILIVLHQMGSHGPAYSKRYPPAFEKFKPVCTSSELSSCSREEISNAYDNTILYTDYFLSEVIQLLKRNTQKYAPTMIYISDHGESLGENGVYLHGLPYMIAPKAQKHIPALIWSDSSSDVLFSKSKLLKDVENSHDSISTTLLDLFEVKTDYPLSNHSPMVALSHD